MSLRSLFSLFSSDLAIDLGTANTCVYARGKGIVVNEPSIVAINKVNGRIEAVGKEAKDMLGRTPGNIVAIKPMKDGVIADFEVTEKMLTYFIKKAHNRNVWVRPRIVIGVPSEITQVEKRAVKDSAYRAKASEVHLVEEAMAAAIGAGMPITEPSGNMIVDIGGGTTDIAVISLAGIVYSKAVRVAGNEMDEAIIHYIKKTYNLLIGERTAEQIKMELGSAFPLEEPTEMEIKGRHLVEGVPKTITISDSEIRGALAETVNVIVDAVRIALERTPPELSADIVDRGIVLTGGGSLLKNLDKRLREETGLPVAMAEDPLSTVVLGAGRMLSDFNLLQEDLDRLRRSGSAGRSSGSRTPRALEPTDSDRRRPPTADCRLPESDPVLTQRPRPRPRVPETHRLSAGGGPARPPAADLGAGELAAGRERARNVDFRDAVAGPGVDRVGDAGAERRLGQLRRAARATAPAPMRCSCSSISWACSCSMPTPRRAAPSSSSSCCSFDIPNCRRRWPRG